VEGNVGAAVAEKQKKRQYYTYYTYHRLKGGKLIREFL
jgi:hypothetical protein